MRKKYVWLANICVLVEETFEVPLMLWKRADGHHQGMPAPFFTLRDTNTLVKRPGDSCVVPDQMAVSNGSASDSATMLRTNATKLEVNTNGNAGAVKQRSSVFTNWHRKESSGCGFSVLVLAKDLFRKIQEAPRTLWQEDICSETRPSEHCSSFSKSYAFLPTAMQSQNTVCKRRHCNCF